MSSNLLKTFGKGADVQAQLASDKAIRRKSTANVRGFDVTSGNLLSGTMKAGATRPIPVEHGLGKDPQFVFTDIRTASSVSVARTDATYVYLNGNDNDTYSLWVA